MKIKLVTFAPHANYGTCLQSYAMNSVLRKLNHDVEFIYNGREVPPIPLSQTVKILIRKCIPNIIWNTIQRMRGRALSETGAADISSENVSLHILKLPDNKLLSVLSKLPFYEYFSKKNYCTSILKTKLYSFIHEEDNYKMRRLYTKNDYKSVVEDADLFLTASDQIWNPYCGGYNPMMFLEFADDARRISYSSSISRPSFPLEIEDRAKKALAKFSHIAVREQSSVTYLSNLLNREDVQLVVDPTYLLTTEEWTLFAEKAIIEFQLPEKYILCYFVGSAREADYDKMVNDVKNAYGIDRVITITYHDNQRNFGDGFIYRHGGPHEFIHLIRNASVVCMDSFHATVLALKFKVDFVHILKTKGEGSTASQNTRMYDILSRYGLLYKLYDNSLSDWTKPINFESVHSIMNQDIEQSMAYLIKALNNQ